MESMDARPAVPNSQHDRDLSTLPHVVEETRVSVLDSLTTARRTNARRRPTTSSERGKAFRARRRIYRGELENQIKTLHEEIARLVERKTLLQSQVLQRRDSAMGSSIRLIREYYTVFRFGMGDRRRALVDAGYACRNAADTTYKENFLHSIMTEDAPTGDLVGPDASLMQWQVFSMAHSLFSVRIIRVDVTGNPQDPFFDLHSTVTAVCGPQTLALLFPGAEKIPGLVHRFDKRQVTFPLLTRFKFNSDGRICFEQVSTNLLDGYLRAGIAMSDIKEMFKFSVVSSSLTVKEDTLASSFDNDRLSLDIRQEDQRLDRVRDSHDLQPRGHRRHWFIYDTPRSSCSS